MEKKKMTREEALRRWNAALATKRSMVKKLERLVKDSCKERTGEDVVEVEVW